MKKIILSFSVIAATAAFAQKNARVYNSNELITKDVKQTNTLPIANEKTIETLWLDNFSNPATWTIDNSGQTGATFGWNINATKEG
ncbi:MAG: hypothetical protein FJX99_04620, partial [Bacteroidetes bacterium]|nr:hypothetical protein [Bacteroidota bacterium]